MPARPLPTSASSRTSRHILVAMGWDAYEILQGVARFAGQAGWRLDNRILRSGYVPERWEGDGIITIIGDNAPIAHLVENSRLPTVSMTCEDIDRVDLCVAFDDKQIGELAAAHMLGRGLRAFAVMHTSDNCTERARFDSFAQAVRRSGAGCRAFSWEGHRSGASVWSRECMDWTVECLRTLSYPTGVFCHNDDDALRVLEACEIARLHIPEQVAVLGVNNEAILCEHSLTPLSSIDPGLDQLGYAGAQALYNLIEKRARRRRPILLSPHGVVERRSTRIEATDSLAAALVHTYVCDHFGESDLSTESVAKHFQLTRASLHSLYKQAYGRSIAEEISRQRLCHAQELLTTTDLKVGEIKARVGIQDAETFSRFFKRHTGMTAPQYRRSLQTDNDQP